MVQLHFNFPPRSRDEQYAKFHVEKALPFFSGLE